MRQNNTFSLNSGRSTGGPACGYVMHMLVVK